MDVDIPFNMLVFFNYLNCSLFIILFILHIVPALILYTMLKMDIKLVPTIIIWLCLSYLIWILLLLINKFYRWLNMPNTNGSVDAAKLTIVWTVIYLLISRLS